jgi:hypothetical protein
MIHHVHSMLSSGTEPSAAGNTNTPASRDALHSFESALSDAASSTVATFGTDPNAGQVTPASGTTTPASTTASSGSSASMDPLQAIFGGVPETVAPAASTSTTVAATTTAVSNGATPNEATPSAAADPTLAFDNTYWASQPAAVQPLRNMNLQEREGYAEQLASEGYSIDVPIMVWGWDPSMVTSMRQADGYTWVPSGNQSPVEMAPGLGSIGNLTAYNANNPPAGSITVPPAGSAAV